jgi:hypothetical protein
VAYSSHHVVVRYVTCGSIVSPDPSRAYFHVPPFLSEGALPAALARLAATKRPAPAASIATESQSLLFMSLLSVNCESALADPDGPLARLDL